MAQPVKALATQARRPKFKPQNPHKKQICNPSKPAVRSKAETGPEAPR